ncbi:CoA transferase [Variovorax rhizosphaerae]|uniref:CoA transferase n=1 Tax=Variovorax rhizosphaerae TaxID=1836200 RepID=A0ABU8WFV0_9BURK
MTNPEARMQAPYAGLKIVDLSAVVSGPMAAGLLADQGADVIKVETPKGDLTRVIGPAKGDISALFASINRGKRSIVLDLKHAEGAKVLRDLIAGADVLVENFRPGALSRLGFSYEAVSAFNPRIVYLSISGFGQTGPYAGYRVYDPVIQAVSGFADAHPNPESGEPQLLQTLLCDKITALTAAQALGAALHARSQTGRGQKIELSMLDAALSFLWPEALYNHSFLDGDVKPLPEFGANQKLWRARDGWFAMITPQDDEFAAMCHALGVPELVRDPRFVSIPVRRLHQAELRGLIEPLIAEQDVDMLIARLGAAGVPVGKVNHKRQLADDPQVRANASLQESAQAGVGRLRSARAAAKFSAVPAGAAADAPHLGEHTLAILRELGRTEEQITSLVACGAVQPRQGA